MRLSLVLSPLCLLLASAASATPYHPIAPLSPLHELRNAERTEVLYTVDDDAAFRARAEGFEPHDEQVWIERSAQTGTQPLLRFRIGAPAFDQVYLTADRAEEIAVALSLGYVADGEVGHLHVQPFPGAQAWYRLARFGDAGDVEHRYTASAERLARLVAAGYVQDGIAGWVASTHRAGAFLEDGYLHAPGGHVITRRCGGIANCHGTPSFRDHYSSFVTVQSTPKPVGASRQVMTFTLESRDLFGATQDEHLAIALHGNLALDFNNIDSRINHHGVGIIVGATACGRGTVKVEAYWPNGNAVSSTCPTMLAPLRNDSAYEFRIAVDDEGQLDYDVHEVETGERVMWESLDTTRLFAASKAPFPTAMTGWFLAPATVATADYTAWFRDLRVRWETARLPPRKPLE
jgi:hypothetical protein